MGNEAPAANVLHRPPRPPREQLLDALTIRRVAVLGTVIAVACLLTGAYARHGGHPWQSMLFLTLAFSQLAAAIALRPRGAGLMTNPLLTGTVVLNVLLAVLAVSWLPLRELLHTTPLDAPEIVLCAAAAIIPAITARVQALRQRVAVPADEHDRAADLR
jgi:P-type Ca2+ transporter type 2C